MSSSSFVKDFDVIDEKFSDMLLRPQDIIQRNSEKISQHAQA